MTPAPTALRAGFTLIEMVVAIVVLGSGVLLLAGGSLFVTRELQRSREGTRAAALADAQMETLRVAAASTSPPCTASTFAGSASAVTSYGVTLSWSVSSTGAVRTLRVVTAYPVGRGRTKTDTLTAVVTC